MLLLVLSGMYLCSRRLSALRGRVSVARGLCGLVRYVSGQIECYAMPCGEILRRAPRELLLACGYTAEEPPSDFLALCEAIEIEDGECRRIFSEFARELGWKYRDEQVKSCQRHLEELCERQKYLSERLPTECRVTLALSCSAVLALLILSL